MSDDRLHIIKLWFDGTVQLDLDQARVFLEQEIEEAHSSWGTPLALKTLAFLLYREGNVEDAPLIWSAKASNLDCFSSLDVELVAGAGPEVTIAYLEKQDLNALPVVEYDGQERTAISYLKASLHSRDFALRDPDYIESVEGEIREAIEDLLNG